MSKHKMSRALRDLLRGWLKCPFCQFEHVPIKTPETACPRCGARCVTGAAMAQWIRPEPAP